MSNALRQDPISHAVYQAKELPAGELQLELEVPSVGDSLAVTKELVQLGRLFWVRETHAEGAEPSNWVLGLQTLGRASYDQNPIDALREHVRVKGGTIPNRYEDVLVRLRNHFDREFTATGPAFESEGPQL